MAPLVQLSNVSRVYDGGASTPALADVTLELEAGEFTAVMGPSGCGKSTLLNLVAGLDRPSSGQVLVAGINVGGASEAELARYRRTAVGFVFQFFNLLPNLTVLENVMVPVELAGQGRKAARSRARELLAELHIDELAASYPSALSGGQRQRVAIARALANRPRLILADEPTGALDSAAGEQVMDLLDALNRSGQTILLVTHDVKLAAAHGRRVISLRDGRVVDDTAIEVNRLGPPADLLRLRVEEA